MVAQVGKVTIRFILLLVIMFCKDSNTASWSETGLQPDEVIHACARSSVSFPWNVTMGTGETILSIEWFYEGRSQEKIAMLSQGSFAPLPAFFGRVELTANDVLVFHHLAVLDSGNYSVAVTIQGSNGTTVVLHRTAIVDISDSIRTHDKTVQVSMSSEAKFDNSTQQWRAVLLCGTFNYTNPPPFNVTWTIPENNTQISTAYENGGFLLLLPASAPGGSYTCRVPSHPSASCQTGGDVTGRVVVERTDIRLLILEAQQQMLVSENAKLKEQNEELALRANGGEPIKHVSFHARLYTAVNLPTWTKLVMTDVISNHGNAYSNETGEFLAPYNGTYFFIASTAVYGTDHVANFFLMVDDTDVDYAYTNSWSGHSEGGTVHAVVNLTAGQRVWLRSYQHSYYLDGSTAFSGFLVYRNM